MKIIFMGTSDFAIPSLKELIRSREHEVVAVFTSPPKQKNRGLKEMPSEVHLLADRHSIPVYNPKTLKDDYSTDLIRSISADIIIVVAYGFLIPPSILNAKKYGCLNIHPSLLPLHRGAAPLQHTILNGDKVTAVCIMQMDEGFDTGDIILKKSFPLPDRITFQALHDQCSQLGAELLSQVLKNIDTLPRVKQSEIGVTMARKFTKQDGKVNWDNDAYKIDSLVRALNPNPGVYFECLGKRIKILESDYILEKHELPPGLVGDDLSVACGNGRLIIKRLQQEGRKPLNSQEFLRGTKIPIGTIVS